MTINVQPGGRWRKTLAASLLLAGSFASTFANAGPTLDKIKERGAIKVGVGTTPGFFAPDDNGKWQGFFIDYGRALAIAVFNDPEKVEFTNSSPQQRLPALQAGEFDVLLSGVTVTISRAFQLGFHFGPTIFYDGQGILVRKDLGVTTAAELDGATIGVQSGTTGELNIADFFRKTGKKFTPVTIEDTGEFINALDPAAWMRSRRIRRIWSASERSSRPRTTMPCCRSVCRRSRWRQRSRAATTAGSRS